MPNPNLIFIGPKVEPWMETDELYARMSYFQLSERLRSSIAKLSSCPDTTTTVDSDRKKNNEKNGYSIYFLDSLTLFCGETGNKSIVGGQAIAQRTYFDEDELHLGQNGYEIWKKRVEEILKDIIAITCGKMVDRT
jgi:lysophospholipase L1-like esterase